MKISELIQYLVWIKAGHGDLPVYSYDSSDDAVEKEIGIDSLEILESNDECFAGMVFIPALPERLII